MTTTSRTTASPAGLELAAMTPQLLYSPATDAVAGGASIAIATTANTLTLATTADRGIDLNGAQVFGGVTANGITQGVYLPIPCGINITVSASTGSVHTIRGRNQFDQPIVEQITMTQASMSSKTAWRYIESIKTTLGTGAGTETISVGWKWANTLAARSALALPFKLKSTLDIIGVSVLDAGGSSLANIVVNTPIAAAAYTVDINTSTIQFSSGAITTQPTSLMRFALMMTRDSFQKY